MAIVLTVENSPAACDMWLDAPEIQGGQPGQFVMAACGSLTLRRPLGMAGREGRALRLVFAVKGAGTRWLAARKPGDFVDVLGPLGRGFPEIAGRVLLVGGGLGLPPLLYAAACYDCDAALGFRDKASVILVSDMADVCRDVRVATDDGGLGLQGSALTAADALAYNNRYAAVFVCGPVPLLRAATAWAEERKLPAYVSLEERMACGVGACLVCACAADGGYRRVCKDGPVFLAGEVDWT